MHFDASGIIHAWDEYPISNFPKFWDWIEAQIKEETCKISEEAIKEVAHKYPECAKWLKEKGIKRISLNNEILVHANSIKELLGIEEENYGSGVDEIDLYILATAQLESETILTTEARQNNLPLNKKNYKIPAVCDMPEVAIGHLNVREWIVSSGMVF